MVSNKKSPKTSSQPAPNFFLTWVKRIGVLTVLVLVCGWLDTIKVRGLAFGPLERCAN